MQKIKKGSWLYDLIEVYNELGGIAPYHDVYRLAKRKREARGTSWTATSDATIRRTVEDNAESSDNFKGRKVFYSVHGHGKGVWGLLPEFLTETRNENAVGMNAYVEGLEGIAREVSYLRKSRDPRLVEQRKTMDDFSCQVCSFRLGTSEGKYVIDVHHLNPIGSMQTVVVTSINDLICLCPNCHRIAHTRRDRPLTLDEISSVRKGLNK